jgi:integrase
MRDHTYEVAGLFSRSGGRKYLNAAERLRFIEAAKCLAPEICQFCAMLCWSGGRISEILALTPASIDIDGGVASLQTLKRRKSVVRQVPVPGSVLHELDQVFDRMHPVTAALRS